MSSSNRTGNILSTLIFNARYSLLELINSWDTSILSIISSWIIPSYPALTVPKTLRRIGKVDICICEGTTFSRPREEHQMTEQELVNEIIEQTKGYSQILCL